MPHWYIAHMQMPWPIGCMTGAAGIGLECWNNGGSRRPQRTTPPRRPAVGNWVCLTQSALPGTPISRSAQWPELGLFSAFAPPPLRPRPTRRSRELGLFVQLAPGPATREGCPVAGPCPIRNPQSKNWVCLTPLPPVPRASPHPAPVRNWVCFAEVHRIFYSP
jgi:hypothetical protein